ncbi:MAG: hypothetical protein R3B82_13615 [Sandaracinaceae bacterium]
MSPCPHRPIRLLCGVLALLVAALAWSSLAGVARAQGARAYHALHVGVVEERCSSREERSREESPGVGGLAGLEMPVSRFLSIGGEGGATAWNLFASEGPSVMIHGSVAPRARVAWGTSASVHGELHLVALVGPSLDLRGSSGGHPSSAWARDVGMGFHTGALLGATVFPIRGVGVELDAGYVHHVVWHGEQRVDLGHLQLRTALVLAI